MSFSGLKVTTCLKKSNALLPASVCGNAVTLVGRGHEIIDVKKIPIRMAPFTRYSIRNTVKIQIGRAHV